MPPHTFSVSILMLLLTSSLKRLVFILNFQPFFKLYLKIPSPPSPLVQKFYFYAYLKAHREQDNFDIEMQFLRCMGYPPPPPTRGGCALMRNHVSLRVIS